MSIINQSTALFCVILPTLIALSASMDLRNGNFSDTYVPNIYASANEGACSISWAITTAQLAADVFNQFKTYKSEANGLLGSGLRWGGYTGNNYIWSRKLSYQYLIDCCKECWTGFPTPCDGGNFREAMNFIVNTGLPTGRRFGENQLCKNANAPECYQDPVLAAAAGTPPCTDANIDLQIASISGTCTSTCDAGSTTSFILTKVTRYQAIPYTSSDNIANMVNAISGVPRRLLLTEMEVFEDLFEIRGNTFYTRTYGRSLGWITVAIYGFLLDPTKGQEYWIVRLPFGDYFGDRGYVRVAKGINNCGIETPGNQFYFSME